MALAHQFGRAVIRVKRREQPVYPAVAGFMSRMPAGSPTSARRYRRGSRRRGGARRVDQIGEGSKRYLHVVVRCRVSSRTGLPGSAGVH